MGENKHHHEEDVARLLAEHWEEVEMDSAYELSVLDQTRRAVASSSRTNTRIWQAVFASAIVVVITAVMLWQYLAVPAVKNAPFRLSEKPAGGVEKPVVNPPETPESPQPQTMVAVPAASTGERSASAGSKDSLSQKAAGSTGLQAVNTQKEPASSQPLVVITALRQPVTDQQGRKLKAGDRLTAGSVLRTGKDGRVTLVTQKGAELSLDAGSELALASAGIASIRKGRLYCSNRDGEISRIDTPAGQVQLLGTVVNTAVIDKEKVAVTVLEGKVQLKNANGKALVDSGKQSLLVASLPPEPGKPVNTLAETAWYDGRGDILSDFGDIAYLIEREPGLLTEIWAMNSDGSNRRRVRSYTGHNMALGPWLPGEQWLQTECWSILWTGPDVKARRAHTKAGHPIINERMWLLNAATGQDIPFPLPEGYDPLYTAMPPNCKRMAFCGWYLPDPNDRGKSEHGVWVYDIETGKITKILDGQIKSLVAWAPDSRRLATSTGKGYTIDHSLVVIDTESGEVTKLGINGAGPVFSPDGTKLAYCGGFKGDGKGGSWYYGVPTMGSIWVKDLTSDAEPMQVSPDGEGGVEPHWSPDGTRIVYQKTVWKPKDEARENHLNHRFLSPYAGNHEQDYHHFFSLYTANVDGSGSKEIYNAEGRLRTASWARSGDAVYATTSNAVLLIAADGSGLIGTIPTDEKNSILPPDQQAQTDAAISKLQEAVFQFAMGKVYCFEGDFIKAREAYRKSQELFAGLVWKYPLSGLITADTLVYADKANEMASAVASKSEAEMLSEACRERLRYAGAIAGYATDKENGLPADLKGVENWALNSKDWGIDWIFSNDTEHVKMVFKCPGTHSRKPVSYVYNAPAKGTAPKIGDVLISCPNHPDNKVVWDENMQAYWERAMEKK